jgi:O-antigen/teichoic acid export membrane protein
MIKSSFKLFQSRLLQNTFSYFAVTFIGKIIPFLIVPYMTALLTPEQFGIAATYIMYISFFLLVIGFELNRFIDVKYFQVDDEEFSRNLSTVVSLVFIWSMTILIMTTLSRSFIPNSEISFIWICLIPTAVFFKFVNILNVNLLRNEDNPKLYGVYSIFETTTYSFISLLLAWAYHSWTSKGVGQIASMCLFGVFGFIRLKRHYNLTFNIDKEIFRKAVLYSIPFVFGLNLANNIFFNSDKIILNHFFDFSTVGIYAIAYSFASIVGFVTDSFMKAWSPIFYRKLKNNDRSVDRQSILIFILLGFVTIVSIALVRFIMPFMIDESYNEAVIIMPYIAVLFIIRNGEQLLLFYINYYGKTGVLYAVVILTILSSVVAAYFLVKFYGMIGMAISMNLFVIFKLLYYLFIVKDLRFA